MNMTQQEQILISLKHLIETKKSRTHIKNKDNICLKYCVQTLVHDKVTKDHSINGAPLQQAK